MKSRISYLFFGVVMLMLLYTCELFSEGYGDKADLRDPELTIDGTNGGYIMGSFTLEGTVEDDIAIDSVVVDITNYVTNETERREAIINDTRWSLSIDTLADSIFSDGEIEFVVTAKDTSNKSVNQKRLLFVDNMKPTVLINTPDQYGVDIEYNQKITIKGETKDFRVKENIVKLINNDTGEVFSVEADKTPSWSADFDTEALGMTIGTYYLVIESEDMAGNINDYFYHFSDTLGLIAPSRGATVEELASSSYRDSDPVIAIRRNSTDKILLSVNPDSDNPVVIINAWADDEGNDLEKEFKGEVRIDGTISDDDGIDSITIELSNKNGLLRSETLEFSELVKNKTIDVGLSTLDWGDFGVYSGTDTNLAKKVSKEGVYSVKIIVTDINENDSNINSVKKTTTIIKNYRIDGGYPALEVDKDTISGSYFTNAIDGRFVQDDFQIKGYASDGNGVAVKAIFEDQAPGGTTREFFLGQADADTEEVYWTFDSSSAKEITAYNSASNTYTYGSGIDLVNSKDYEFLVTISVTDGVKVTERTLGSLIVDVAPPVVEIELEGSSSVVNGNSVTTFVRSSDSAGIGSVDVKVYYDYKGANEFVVPLTQTSTSISSWVGTFDSTKFINSTTAINAKVVARVTDKSNNTTEEVKNFIIDQSTDIPTITFSNIDSSVNSSISIAATPTETENLFTSNYKILGSAQDDDSLDASTLEIALNGSSFSSITPKGVDKKIINWNYSFTDSILNSGDNYFKVKVKDINGKEFISPDYHFYVDKDTPSLTIKDNKPDEGLEVKSSITLRGDVTDSHLDRVEVLLEGGSVKTADITTTPGKWSLVTNASEFSKEGTNKISITAKDKFGKYTSKEIYVSYDKTAPTITVSPIVSEVSGSSFPVLSGTYRVEGTASDLGSSIEKVRYSLNYTKDGDDTNDTWYDVTGTTTWYYNLKTTDLSEGNHTIYFKSLDKAGNETLPVDIVSKTITVDQAAPDFTETGLGHLSFCSQKRLSPTA